MKIPALILCIIAALLTLFFAVRLISFYISPPDLSVPEGLNEIRQFYWETSIEEITPVTYLAFGLIGVASAIAGILGGLLGYFEKRLPLARVMVIAAACAGAFMKMGSASFIYLAAAVSMLRDPEKAAGELVTLTLAFFTAAYIFPPLISPFFDENFFGQSRFQNAILLTANTLSVITVIAGYVLAALLSGIESIILFKRRQPFLAAALAVISICFILIFTPAVTVAAFLPFILFVFGLVVFIIKLRKPKPKAL